MKKYSSLSELLIDYRHHKKMTQADLAAKLDVDSRSIIRWEKGLTQINRDKEAEFSELLMIPFQVIRNLNSDPPISIFYDLERRSYSHSAFGTVVKRMSFFIEDFPLSDDIVQSMASKKDYQYVDSYLKNCPEPRILTHELFEKSVNLIPELNLIAIDQSLYYSGHIFTIPLKEAVFEKLLNQELLMKDLNVNHIQFEPSQPIRLLVFTLHADSIDPAYYLLRKFFEFFKSKKYTNYRIACVPESENSPNLWRQAGLKSYKLEMDMQTSELMVGDFDMFLFQSKL